MQLYVMRHGIAEDRDAAPGRPDGDRPLTERGRRRVRAIARGMKGLGVSFEAIWTSPLLRARQTADGVAEVYGMESAVEECPALQPGGDPRLLVRTLLERPVPVEGVLLVGHEPDAGELVSLLVTGRTSSEFRMKKGGVCALSAERLEAGACARLEWLLAPRHWIAIAGEDRDATE
jgi:phosphohistidine phosphatase